MTIYVQNGYTQNADLTALPATDKGDFMDLLQLVKSRPVVSFTTPEEISNYKKTKAPYIIAGEMQQNEQGVYHRNDEGLKSRSVLIIDFDGLKAPKPFISAVQKTLKGITHYFYPTISAGSVKKGHENEDTYWGFRLVVAVDKSFGKSEHKRLVDAVCHELGIAPDNATKTWSQLQGAPVQTSENQYGSYQGGAINDTKPLVVDDWLEKSAEIATTKPAKLREVTYNSVSDKEAVRAIEVWTARHAEELQEEASFTSVIRFLVEAEKEGQISAAVVDAAGSILAMGNSDWEAANASKISAQRRQKLDRNHTSFANFFGITATADVHKSYTLDGMLKELGDKAYNWLQGIQEAAPNGKKPSLLPDKAVAKIISETVPNFKVIIDKNTSLLYLYNPATGVCDSSLQYARYLLYTIDEACSTTAQRSTARQNEVLATLTVKAPVKSLERNKRLCVLANGVYDIQASKLMPFSPAYRFETKAATAFKPQLKEPVIMQADGSEWRPSEWLNSLAQGDKQIVELLWQVIADTVETNWSHEQAVILVGSKGRDGKSTFAQLLRGIAGSENTSVTSIQLLDQRFVAAQLQGKSLLIGDDMDSGVYLEKSAVFKSVTSGDTITADRKGLSPVTFVYTGAVVQLTNELPKFADKSGGIMRRLCLVPFTANFGGDGEAANTAIKDDYLKRKEVKEWLMTQALLHHGDFDKYVNPDASKALLDDFKVDNDSVRAFIESDEAQSIQAARVPVQWLYEKYTKWADENGYKRTNQRQFMKRFIEALSDNRLQSLTTEDLQRLANGTPLYEIRPLKTVKAEHRKARLLTGAVNYFPDYQELGGAYDRMREASGNTVIDKNKPYSCICFPDREALLDSTAQ